jgi:hypothetical protein
VLIFIDPSINGHGMLAQSIGNFLDVCQGSFGVIHLQKRLDRFELLRGRLPGFLRHRYEIGCPADAIFAEVWSSLFDWNTFEPAFAGFPRNDCLQAEAIDDDKPPIAPANVTPGNKAE